MACLLSELENDALVDLVPKLHGGLNGLWPLLHLLDMPFNLRIPTCYGALHQQHSTSNNCSCGPVQTTVLLPFVI